MVTISLTVTVECEANSNLWNILHVLCTSLTCRLCLPIPVCRPMSVSLHVYCVTVINRKYNKVK